MRIPVLGMDPSLRNWGLASGLLDLDTGVLELTDLSVVQPREETSKQVRKNSKDLEIAHILANQLLAPMRTAKVIFVEVPVGSQSARAMASYGICVGILGTMQAQNIQIIEVTAFEVKHALTGNKNATKDQMIQKGMELYPDARWPMHKGQAASKSEHIADAIGAIHAGVKTPVFQNLMQLLKGTR